MKALVFCGDRWHPAVTVRAGLAPLKEDGFEFDYIEDAASWSAARMAGYGLVVLSKANNVSETDHEPWATEAAQADLRDHVRGGNALLVLHSGTAGYRDASILRGLMGGVFIQHPPQCSVTVKPTVGHPLTTGSEPFTVKDEHYFMELDDERADVFLSAESEHGSQPAGWTRTEGTGRVCVLTPGHNLEVWLHPTYQTLMRNGLQWCSPSV